MIDTDPAIPIGLQPGENKPDVNFGYVPGGLSGFAYVDANRNGVKDAGEAGLGNVTITGPAVTQRRRRRTAATASTTSTAGIVQVSAPAAASGKALFTASPLSVTLAAGATSTDNNFGYVPGGLSGFAYVDANRNSIKDAGEAGHRRRDDHGPGGTTDDAADGSYSFSNLDAGHLSGDARRRRRAARRCSRRAR